MKTRMVLSAAALRLHTPTHTHKYEHVWTTGTAHSQFGNLLSSTCSAPFQNKGFDEDILTKCVYCGLFLTEIQLGHIVFVIVDVVVGVVVIVVVVVDNDGWPVKGGVPLRMVHWISGLFQEL